MVPHNTYTYTYEIFKTKETLKCFINVVPHHTYTYTNEIFKNQNTGNPKMLHQCGTSPYIYIYI